MFKRAAATWAKHVVLAHLVDRGNSWAMDVYSKHRQAGRDLAGSNTCLSRVPKDSADANSGFPSVCTLTSSFSWQLRRKQLGGLP
jgi:hypothetical protein